MQHKRRLRTGPPTHSSRNRTRGTKLCRPPRRQKKRLRGNPTTHKLKTYIQRQKLTTTMEHNSLRILQSNHTRTRNTTHQSHCQICGRRRNTRLPIRKHNSLSRPSTTLRQGHPQHQHHPHSHHRRLNRNLPQLLRHPHPLR